MRILVDEEEFIEVFIDAPLKVCEHRDPKGLYQKARKGDLPNFTGIDSPYEVPEKPEIHIVNDKISIEEVTTQIIGYLKEKGYLHA